jgi:hypothetical protein
LLAVLDEGHHGVTLAPEERDRIACWIDLAVPYCGDYVEANTWSESEMRKFERYSEKRRRMEEIMRDNLRQMVGLPELRHRSGYMR